MALKPIGFGVFLTLAVLLLPACKPQGTQIKSLENFASNQTVATNKCQSAPNQDVGFVHHVPVEPNDGEIIDTKLLGIARQTLSAVPEGLATYFVTRRGLRIVVSKNAGKICSGALAAGNAKPQSPEGPLPDSCWIFVPISAENPVEHFRIFLQANENAIRHGLVRQFGYLYSQFFSRLNLAKDTSGKAMTVIMSMPSPGSLDDKVSIGTSYVLDLLTSRVFSGETLDRFLGTGALAVVKNNYPAVVRGEKTNLFAGVSLLRPGETAISADERRMRLIAFFDFAIAEAFDSYFCKPFGNYNKAAVAEAVKHGVQSKEQLQAVLKPLENTRQRMHDFFPRTFAAFIPIAANIEALSGRYVVMGKNPGSSSSLALLEETAGVAEPATQIEAPSVATQPVEQPVSAEAPTNDNSAQIQQGPLAAVDQPLFNTATTAPATRSESVSDQTVCSFYDCRAQLKQSLPYLDQDPILSSWADVVQSKVDRADSLPVGLSQADENGNLTVKRIADLPITDQLQYKQSLVAQELGILRQNAQKPGVEGQVYSDAIQNGRNFPFLQQIRQSVSEAETPAMQQRRQDLLNSAMKDPSGLLIPLYASEARKSEAEVVLDMQRVQLKDSADSAAYFQQKKQAADAAGDAAYQDSWRKSYIEDPLRKVGELPGSVLFELGRTGIPTAGVGLATKEWLGGMTGGVGRFIARPIRTSEQIIDAVSADTSSLAQQFKDSGVPGAIAYPSALGYASIGRPLVQLAEETESFASDGGRTRVDLFSKKVEPVYTDGLGRMAEDLYKTTDAVAIGLGPTRAASSLAAKLTDLRPISGGMVRATEGSTLESLATAADDLASPSLVKPGTVFDKGANPKIPNGRNSPIFSAEELAWAKTYAAEGHDVFAVPGSSSQRSQFISDASIDAGLGKYTAQTPRQADAYISGIGRVDFKTIGGKPGKDSFTQTLETVVENSVQQTPPRGVRAGFAKPSEPTSMNLPKTAPDTPVSRIGNVQQTANLAIDVAQTKMTLEEATQTLQRLQQKPDVWNRINSVRVRGEGYDFTVRGGRADSWMFRTPAGN